MGELLPSEYRICKTDKSEEYIVCFECWLASFNKNDIQYRFCGNCRRYHSRTSFVPAEMTHSVLTSGLVQTEEFDYVLKLFTQHCDEVITFEKIQEPDRNIYKFIFRTSLGAGYLGLFYGTLARRLGRDKLIEIAKRDRASS